MSENIKNITRKILSKAWATLTEVDYDFKFKDGSWKRISRESYDRGNGTAVLLYNSENKNVILTKQFRMPIYENTPEEAMSIEACAGAIDKNESAKNTILREIEEEVGYKVKELTKIMEIYMSPGASTEKMFLYTAPYTQNMKVNEGGGLESENEEIEVMELAFSKALQMVSNGDIMDAKTVVLLQYAQLNNLL